MVTPYESYKVAIAIYHFSYAIYHFSYDLVQFIPTWFIFADPCSHISLHNIVAVAIMLCSYSYIIAN